MAEIFQKIYAWIMAILMTIFPSIFGTPVNERPEYEVNNNILSLTLPSNASTGCSWEWEVEPAGVIKLVSTSYVEQDNNGTAGSQSVVGRGGYQTFSFKAVGDGKATLKLTYGQHWEGGEMFDSRTFICTVDAQGNLTVDKVIEEAPSTAAPEAA